MKITKTSSLTGRSHTMDLPVSWEQLEKYNEGKEYIQNIFPNLNAGQREFIQTGITPEEWNELFKRDEEEWD